MILTPGTKACVNLPSILPSWFLEDDCKDWRNSIVKNNGQVITVRSSPRLGFWPKAPETHSLYFVEIEELYGSLGFYYCVDWLIPQAAGKIPCNCSLSSILIKGCKVPNHV